MKTSICKDSDRIRNPDDENHAKQSRNKMERDRWLRIICLVEPYLYEHDCRRSAGARIWRKPMLNVKRTIIFAMLAAAMIASGAKAAQADSFGAISISPQNGATGWSHSYSSRWEAEEVAQTNCDQYAGDCRVAIWFKNACGAVARGPDGWGADWGDNRRDAEYAAIRSCEKHSYDCQIIRWQCSGAR
ncbi:DUF4189 domain-containing protein [Rhizobium sp. 32-5/1]|uniref:DUF4189 domain-containing protein n=1 Tax=Rhizobium sp. 32-5/1 TaxID=3019602 RepID=UPI00240D9012|nr:DUF4189 domain-containing protein [Rhizobium sp. 32-5/1]WEZ83158.1 DUF4189 domain-containing protein [Rhizobium sp. 32-5/1]